MTSPIPSPPASTASTSTTPFVSMTFNPATSLFSTASGFKSLAGPTPGGPLTPKSHETQGNIVRPTPVRSRFFHAEDIIHPNRAQPSFKPWLDDDKENYQKPSARAFEKTLGVFDKTQEVKSLEVEKRCLRCYDKAAFVLEPCTHWFASSIFV